MTNADIITETALELMRQGKIGTTGRVFKMTVINKDGNEQEREFLEPEPIHTFARWKDLGYKVKKGEHAIARVPIWKYTEKKVTDDDGNEIDDSSMFLKTSCFFSRSQVEEVSE